MDYIKLIKELFPYNLYPINAFTEDTVCFQCGDIADYYFYPGMMAWGRSEDGYACELCLKTYIDLIALRIVEHYIDSCLHGNIFFLKDNKRYIYGSNNARTGTTSY